jgi:hypothetical protein
MNGKQDIVFKRCGCTDAATGRQLAAHCPRLAEPGHGSRYYAMQVATVGGRKARYRLGGFPTRPAAIAARQAILDGPAGSSSRHRPDHPRRPQWQAPASMLQPAITPAHPQRHAHRRVHRR